MPWKNGLDFERERDVAVELNSLLQSHIATLEHELAEANSELARHHNLVARLRDDLEWALAMVVKSNDS
jgi:hypothetical protein